MREFLDRLEGDNRVAILLFDQKTRLMMPLTPLTEATRPDFLLSLDKVDYRGLLTDSPAAIERAIYELKVNGRPDADKSIDTAPFQESAGRRRCDRKNDASFTRAVPSNIAKPAGEASAGSG